MDKLNVKDSAGNEQTKYRATLDIDAYYRSDDLKDINALLSQSNNEEFNIYISCMKESYLNKGFDGYLSKPIDLVEVDNIIEKFLDKQK